MTKLKHGAIFAALLLPSALYAGSPVCLDAPDRVQCASDNLSVGDSQKRIEEVLGEPVAQVSATACPGDKPATDPDCETAVVTIHVLGNDSFVATPDKNGRLLFLDHAKLPESAIPGGSEFGEDPFK